MSTVAEPVSHGRGGQGNIGTDDMEYVDGGIHREGNPSSSGGAYSAGRGGAGNIGSPKQPPVRTVDDDIVPEEAMVEEHQDVPYHSGRGGEGNVHIPEEKMKAHQGLAEKLKRKFFAMWKKK